MSDVKKTNLYLTMKNLKRIKKASYLSDRTMTDIINDILDKNLDDYLKKIEIESEYQEK
jgi:hypothetical protein